MCIVDFLKSSFVSGPSAGKEEVILKTMDEGDMSAQRMLTGMSISLSAFLQQT